MQTPLAGEPWERISIDITGPHPKSSRQNVYILTVVDHFSKWGEATAIPNHTAYTVARALMTNVFARFGMPAEILTDRGAEFESELFSQLLKWLGIEKLRTTAYKPSTNGVVERFHRTLNTVLGKLVSENQRDWDDRLPYAMAAYRASVHTSTGYTPNRIFLGRENRMPVDLAMGLPPNEVNGTQTMDEYVAKQQQIADETYQLVRQNLGHNAQRRKSAYDVKVRKSDYKVGEWIWYHYPRKYTKKSPKWQRNFIGPYRIIRAIPPVNFVIQRSPRSQPFVVHTDKLKHCYNAPTCDWHVPAEQGKEATEGCETVLGSGPSVCMSPDQDQPTTEAATSLGTPPSGALERSCPTNRKQPRHRRPQQNMEPEVGTQEVPRAVRARKQPSHLREYECRTVCKHVMSPEVYKCG